MGGWTCKHGFGTKEGERQWSAAGQHGLVVGGEVHRGWPAPGSAAQGDPLHRESLLGVRHADRHVCEVEALAGSSGHAEQQHQLLCRDAREPGWPAHECASQGELHILIFNFVKLKIKKNLSLNYILKYF